MNSFYFLLLEGASVAAEGDINPFVKMIIIAVVIGVLVGIFYALILKSELTSVYKNDSAADYTKDKSFKVEVSRDTFMYSKTKKEEKPKNEEKK